MRSETNQMKARKFAKMTATGNDFILFDNRNIEFKGKEKDYFRRLCQRRFSVGADGVILIEESCSADFKYRHFNSDGHPVHICGNGARAACRFAYQKKIAGENITFEVNETIYHGWCSKDRVTIDHPAPQDTQTELGIIQEKTFKEGGFAIIGVPHLVIFSNHVQDVDVNELGKKYRHHPRFEKGANVNFVQVLDNHRIKVRTFERGVEGETYACGTGAMASAVISHICNGVASPVEVKTKGGDLLVKWDQGFSRLYLEGEAHLVFEGQLTKRHHF
ncbi:MAG: diaminopimelate epimerase [Candidatus Aminicenantes bacterium]|nr:diaminopimelate epimerase [Candidatus Aminicenantes bacterium]